MTQPATSTPSTLQARYDAALAALERIVRAPHGEAMREIAHAALAELTDLPADDAPALVRVAVVFPSYNPRRYNRPWIARVLAWPLGKRAELEFGTYLAGPTGGEGEIAARAGEIVRWGQRDHRGNHSWANWGIAQADGSVLQCTEQDARRAFSG